MRGTTGRIWTWTSHVARRAAFPTKWEDRCACVRVRACIDVPDTNTDDLSKVNAFREVRTLKKRERYRKKREKYSDVEQVCGVHRHTHTDVNCVCVPIERIGESTMPFKPTFKCAFKPQSCAAVLNAGLNRLERRLKRPSWIPLIMIVRRRERGLYHVHVPICRDAIHQQGSTPLWRLESVWRHLGWLGILADWSQLVQSDFCSPYSPSVRSLTLILSHCISLVFIVRAQSIPYVSLHDGH